MRVCKGHDEAKRERAMAVAVSVSNTIPPFARRRMTGGGKEVGKIQTVERERDGEVF
mgnify:CR=1 FL=1